MKRTNLSKWLKFLKTDPLPVLLDHAPLPIRYLTALRFQPKDKELLEALKRELQEFKPRLKLIRSQQPDGTWATNISSSIEEQQKALQFLQQVKNLGQLLHWGCTIEEPAVQKGVIALLKSQKPDGKFPLLLHHQGLVLWLLVQYGLAGNPFVEKGFRWLIKRQRPDGGWISPTLLPEGESIKTAKSGIWTTLIICQALSSHSRLRHSESTLKAAGFLLENYLQPNHTNFLPEPDAWDHLYMDYSDNGMFRGGTLRFVEALYNLKEAQSHPHFKKAIKWLCEQQLPSGLLPAIVHKSQQGDYGVTLRFITVLSEISPEGTF